VAALACLLLAGQEPLSARPEGLEKRLTEDEFVDLVSFKGGLTETRGR
jgi:hypothetical protein